METEGLRILKTSGVEAFNRWREENRGLCESVGLDEANLQGMDLSGANFSEAYLVSTDFRDTNLYQADFTGASLGDGNSARRADFRGANLRQVKGFPKAYRDWWTRDLKKSLDAYFSLLFSA